MLTLLSQPKHLNWLILAINSRGIVPTPTKRPWTRLPLPLELPSARYFRDPQPLNSNNLRSLGNHYMHTYVCACVRLCVRLEVGYTLQTFIYLAVVLMAFPAWSSQYSDITMVCCSHKRRSACLEWRHNFSGDIFGWEFCSQTQMQNIFHVTWQVYHGMSTITTSTLPFKQVVEIVKFAEHAW